MQTPQVSPAKANELCKEFYGHYVKPLQAEIMAAVLSMNLPRVSVLGATQIQKSRACARALGILAFQGYGITIIAPKAEQATIQLRYFLDLMAGQPLFESQLMQGGESKSERLKARQAKTYLSMKSGGFMRALTVNESDQGEKAKSVLGQGSQIVVMEEASLTSNVAESGIFRMVAGWGERGRIIKLGNAIRSDKTNDHFKRSCDGQDGYYALKFDWKRAVAEGIYSQAFVDAARTKPNFDQYYECKFPDATDLLGEKYTRMIPVGFDLESVVLPFNQDLYESLLAVERPIVGLDIGKGRPDTTELYARFPIANVAFRIFSSSNYDVMAQIGEYLPVLEHANPELINVDAVGMGEGVYPAIQQLMPDTWVQDIRAGEKAPEDGYVNMKAWAFMGNRNMRDSLVNKGMRIYSNGLIASELSEIGYMTHLDKAMKMESKEEMQAREVPSPNEVEALMLTYCKKELSKVAAPSIMPSLGGGQMG